MKRWLYLLLLALLMLSPTLALAHPGHEHGDDDDAFARSVTHAISGWDHWLAALIVGVGLASRWRIGIMAVTAGTLAGLLVGRECAIDVPWLHGLGWGLLVAALLAPRQSPAVLLAFGLYGGCAGLAHAPHISAPLVFSGITALMLGIGAALAHFFAWNVRHPLFRWVTAGLVVGLALTSSHV